MIFFNVNAGIVKGIVEAFAKFSPKAFLAIITNPVNSMIPIAAEVFEETWSL